MFEKGFFVKVFFDELAFKFEIQIDYVIGEDAQFLKLQ